MVGGDTVKKKFDFEQLMEDWIIPIGIVALVVWIIIWLS